MSASEIKRQPKNVMSAATFLTESERVLALKAVELMLAKEKRKRADGDKVAVEACRTLEVIAEKLRTR